MNAPFGKYSPLWAFLLTCSGLTRNVSAAVNPSFHARENVAVALAVSCKVASPGFFP